MTSKEKAVSEIKRRRKSAEEEHANAIAELRRDEAFDALYRRLNSLKWDFVKAKSDSLRDGLQTEIVKAEQEINEKIRAFGLPFDEIELPYFCEKCKDTGTLRGETCECAEKIRIELVLKESFMLSSAPDTFDEIDYTFYGSGESEKRACADFIKKAIDGGKRIFLFAGKTGTGKTFFASVALRELLKKGKEIKAVSAIKLNKELLEYHCSSLGEKSEKWRDIAESDAMLIDDLGAEQILNNVTVPYILELITERAEDKITFITTNLSPIELENRYGQRIVSRLLDKKLAVAVKFGGRDLRITV